MAQFVRIGDTLINLDLVTQMYIGSNYVNVQFGADNYITIRKPEEVAQLKQFMDQQPTLEKTSGQPCYLCDEVRKCFLCGNEVCDHHASMRKYNGNERLICDTCYFAE